LEQGPSGVKQAWLIFPLSTEDLQFHVNTGKQPLTQVKSRFTLSAHADVHDDTE
jgi:hypothetical protein